MSRNIALNQLQKVQIKSAWVNQYGLTWKIKDSQFSALWRIAEALDIKPHKLVKDIEID